MPKMQNPFADAADKQAAQAPAGGAWGNQPSAPAAPPAPAAASAQSQRVPFSTTSGMTAEQLARKEADLNARQAELDKREAALKGVVPLKKNWPACFPITRHDIGADIPSDMRAMVRTLYTCYLAMVLCLSYNFVAASIVLGYKVNNRISSWFLAVIYVVAGVPLAFILWYKRLYNAAASDRALSYVAFFLMFGVHTAFCIWAAIAVPFSKNSWSFAGFATAIQAFDFSGFVGVFYIVGACMWTLESLLSIWCMKLVYSSFRNNKGQAKLQSEVATAVIHAHAAGPTRV